MKPKNEIKSKGARNFIRRENLEVGRKIKRRADRVKEIQRRRGREMTEKEI